MRRASRLREWKTSRVRMIISYSMQVLKFNEEGKVVTNGGRVLGVTALGKDLKEARAKAYEATEWVDFDNKYMRHDIGKAIDEA